MSSVDTPSLKIQTGVTRFHARKRLPIRIDMTPMVDVAFLLLIFFMVTTVFRQPQAMEMVLPKDNTPIPVPVSNLVTLYGASGGEIYWRQADAPIQPMRLEDVRPLLVRSFRTNPELIVLAKIDRRASYAAMIDILDEIQSADVPRFSIVSMTDEDQELLQRRR